ncbi:MAG: cation:proton antiporter [Bacteroidales bacterium]|nr:cation:proton antiporter [Bacteroidales bacterium]
MSEEFHLLSDLALILISAGVVTIIFKLLKQPLVLGYIVAGFLVGPHFGLFPTVVEINSVKEWSEIGIIFLLFALGLEFSFKKLFKVGGGAFVTAGIEIVTVACVGFLTGYLLGWTTMESIILGGMLAMSSTTIIIKAFDDLGLKKEPFADVVFVVLILQDIIAILMMVLISTAAVSQKFSGGEMLYNIVKLLFFLILWFVIGIYFFPTFFKKFKRWINDETLLIISIGLCFGMVVIATNLGFSSALGAFVMGSILSETVEGEHIEKLIKGIKDLFGAIFFVSVGMMVDPTILKEYWGTIMIITFISVVIKAILSSAAVLISGQDLKTSMRAGFSLAQIGEFSFILAALGISLNIMNPTIYPIIVAVSVITIFLTPYCIRSASPIYSFLYKRLPKRIVQQLDSYKLGGKQERLSPENKKMIRSVVTRTIVIGVLCFASIVFCIKSLNPFIDIWLAKISAIFSGKMLMFVNTLITLIVASPFLVGLMTNRSKDISRFSQLWEENGRNRIILMTWIIGRLFLAVFFIVFILSKYLKLTAWLLIPIALGIAMFIFFTRRSLHRFTKLEEHFLTNLNAKGENQEE